MAAQGKINASKVQTGERIIVKVSETGTASISQTKTGEGVQVARVTDKIYIPNHSGFRQPGRYVITTTAGTFEAAPIQTMWLAPEDAAGIKRAHIEALAENRGRELAAEEFTPAEREELAEDFRTSGALDEAHAEALELDAQSQAWEERVAEEMRLSGATRSSAIRGLINRDHLAALAESGPVTPSDHANALADSLTAVLATPENHTGSTVVGLLEKVWARIRTNHPELPEVVIITGSGLLGCSKWGHFRADGWKVQGSATHKHELFLAGEALAKGAVQVLQTMLHEGAHTLAQIRGEKDTSRQGRWHNQIFLNMAVEMGLEYRGDKANKSHGFSSVTLKSQTREKYADLLAELDREIRLVCHLPRWLGGEDDQDEKGGEKIGKAPKGEGDEGKPRSGPMRATCLCDEPVIIRLSQKVMDLGVVRCDDCKSLFLNRS